MDGYCFDEARCRLCQFQIRDGESVLAVLEDGRVSSSFLYDRYTTFWDQGMGIRLYMSYSPGRSTEIACFHDGCYSFKILPISSTFLAAARYNFSPSNSSEKQRQDRFKYALAMRLKFGLLRKIPLELCQMVAGYLVRECAIVTHQELARDVHPSEFTIDLSQDVYATYKRIEDVVYVQSLHNAPHPEGAGTQIVAVRREHVIREIYVKYDHRGIRSIHFALPSRDSLRSFCGSHGVWWSKLALNAGIRRLIVRSDGLKVRSLLEPIEGNVAPGVGWPTPGLDCKVISLAKWYGYYNMTSIGLRMTPFDCNMPATDGYSAALLSFYSRHHKIGKLCAHHSGMSANFYRDMDDDFPHILWMYMPVDQDEYIKEIWASKSFLTGSSALLLLTSHERAVLFGKYELDPEIRRVYTTTNRPSRIYFNEWNKLFDAIHIKYMGVDADATQTDMAQYPPSPTLPSQWSSVFEGFYYTSCRLEDVIEITCCVDKTAPHQPIIGMLLRYGNGRRACVGQYRLDWTFGTLTVDPSRSLSIARCETEKRGSYVAEVNSKGLSEPGPGTISRMDIPWHGRLEWWFSEDNCQLIYSDQ